MIFKRGFKNVMSLSNMEKAFINEVTYSKDINYHPS